MTGLAPARLLVLILLAGFAGCFGNANQGALPESLADGTGGIRGVLVSEELFPVVGALVEVVGGNATTSDETGRFQFFGLTPGEVRLNVSALGYESKQQTVTVTEDAVTEIRIAMVGIPGQSPYAVSLIHDGFIACSFAAVYSGGWFFPVCPVGESQDAFTTEVGADWRAGVHEMEWPTSDEMQLASTLDGPACRASPPPPSKCAALVGGPSSLRIIARPEDAEYAARYAIDGKVTWPTGNHSSTLYSSYSGFFRTEINATFNPACQEINAAAGVPRALGCPFGVGVSTGIRFRYYHTTFYLQMPDGIETFTARPDA